ncbi:hypothetical protein PGTUg99_004143 [Puccinia graminis f. sp. tritici]|uniref:Uncharacterized protein n=1 Tax=Puccinia graminis f. sp. tritici TaxID=56615 RepID=A0A5B0RAG8_PUCGR|nr:hypothetical protein PGTUg99_004143 [Puccinia graminis f. sp. tritici]
MVSGRVVPTVMRSAKGIKASINYTLSSIDRYGRTCSFDLPSKVNHHAKFKFFANIVPWDAQQCPSLDFHLVNLVGRKHDHLASW